MAAGRVAAQVPYQRIVRAESEPHNWLTYGGTYKQQRFSPLDQINKQGFYLTLAPLALDGKIVVGVSGAETGIRAYIDAYDAKTGRRVWRTYTVPAAGEPGADTWGPSSWKTGGGSTWLTGSYDPELNLL